MNLEGFNPSNEKYKKVEDLPKVEQENFADVPEYQGGGFVKASAMDLYDRAENIASDSLMDKETTPIDILHGSAERSFENEGSFSGLTNMELFEKAKELSEAVGEEINEESLIAYDKVAEEVNKRFNVGLGKINEYNFSGRGADHHLRLASSIIKEEERLGFTRDIEDGRLIELGKQFSEEYKEFNDIYFGEDEDKKEQFKGLKGMDLLDTMFYVKQGFVKEAEERLGVDIGRTLTTNEIFTKGFDLERAIDLTDEAVESGYTITGSNEELLDEAVRLAARLTEFKESNLSDDENPDENHSSRLKNKEILLSSIRKELLRRLNHNEGISEEELDNLTEKTGYDFSKLKYKMEILGPKVSTSEGRGRIPQMGASGTWKTARGYVSGRVVGGRPGGPYEIDTPQGIIKVNNIL